MSAMIPAKGLLELREIAATKRSGKYDGVACIGPSPQFDALSVTEDGQVYGTRCAVKVDPGQPYFDAVPVGRYYEAFSCEERKFPWVRFFDDGRTEVHSFEGERLWCFMQDDVL